MSLNYDSLRLYWAVLTEKTFKFCLCKGIVPGILNSKLAFSMATDIFEK